MTWPRRPWMLKDEPGSTHAPGGSPFYTCRHCPTPWLFFNLNLAFQQPDNYTHHPACLVPLAEACKAAAG